MKPLYYRERPYSRLIFQIILVLNDFWSIYPPHAFAKTDFLTRCSGGSTNSNRVAI